MNDTVSHGKKILVVDDAPQNVKLLRAILKDAGYEVLEASSGLEALQRLRQEKPSAMILDVRMPGMTGYDVCKAVRKDPLYEALPVIMVTALSLPEEKIKGIEAGATDFITKPFHKKELLARLQTSLTLAPREQGGIIERFPEAVILASPDWVILGLSPSAASLLGISSAMAAGINVLELLENKSLSASAANNADLDEPWTAELPPSAGQPPFSVRHNPVKNAQGRVVMRLMLLQQGRSVDVNPESPISQPVSTTRKTLC